MTADLKSIVDRFAAEGYLALAPDLYGRGMKIRCVISTIRGHFSGIGPAYDDIAAARDHILANPQCTGKIAIAGFCMGAGFALVVAPRGQFDAAASAYGMNPSHVVGLEQSCPVVASYGARDRIVKSGDAPALEAALTRGGVPHDIKVYPGVGHAFMNNMGLPAPLKFVEKFAGMAHSEPESEDSWHRIFTFFAEHLG